MHKEHFTDWINSAIDKSKYEAEIIFTKYPKHATELSREAAQRGDHLVVAVGGIARFGIVVAFLHSVFHLVETQNLALVEPRH